VCGRVESFLGVEPSSFVVVSSAKLVRRRQSAGVGVGAFGCGSASAEETRAARIRGEPADEREVPLFSFFVYLGCVCVCEASSVK